MHKYNYFSTQSLSTLMLLSDLDTRYIRGFCIQSHSRRAVSTSSLQWNRRRRRWCFSGPNKR